MNDAHELLTSFPITLKAYIMPARSKTAGFPIFSPLPFKTTWVRIVTSLSGHQQWTSHECRVPANLVGTRLPDHLRDPLRASLTREFPPAARA
jgi:hypothetical protein